MSIRALPDVTSDFNVLNPSTLKWVGMEEIAVPIMIKLQNKKLQAITAKANVLVSLDDPNQKGIHMSRLHSIINQLAEHECNKGYIGKLLDEIIESQSDIGQAAKIELSFEIILTKPALLSGKSGYQSYPMTLRAEKAPQGLVFELECRIPYSSTCPCSASLARQLYAQAIDAKFEDATINKSDLLEWIQSSEGSIATPHSQRSYAYIHLVLDNKYDDWPNLEGVVFQIEEMISTPVQTAVKRVDEQEFARLNAENLMFCEDAARRIKTGLDNFQGITNFWLKVEHQESLHAHNAVAYAQKL
ncbi:MAG: GTP cyclohydrolase FolE2 [Pseudomonadota bacterium]